MKSYQLIGLMSGTSLDGLDIVLVDFTFDDYFNYDFNILQAKTYSYSEFVLQKLKNSLLLSAFEIFELDKLLGEVYANYVLDFLSEFNINKSKINAIASHGQTIYHQPEKGITVQIGCGETLALKTGIPVINDFRKKDVIAGGQGAPLVPIGDFHLFSRDAESFLNIGGFVNISFNKNKQIYAFDICPGNLPLNMLMNKINKEYDENGNLARSGNVNIDLFNDLNKLEYYFQDFPKSLGSEWLEKCFMPFININIEIKDLLATVIEHVAFQIAKVLKDNSLTSVFITGGGALNSFLIERISYFAKGVKVIIPCKEIIAFKEALIFAFLGLLYLEKQPNCLSTVTGAKYDVSSGVLHLP